MSLSNEQVQSLMKLSEKRERNARRRAFLLTLIPVFAALAFLAFTIWSTNQVQQELVAKQEELKTAETVLNETVNRYQSVNAQLGASSQALTEVQDQLNLTQSKLDDANRQLDAANQKVQDLEKTIAALQADLESKQKEYNDLEYQVRLASRFSSVRSYYEWQEWLKEDINYIHRLYANDRAASAMAERLIMTLDSLYSMSPPIPFNGRGANPDEGFTSPSFAMFVLQEIGRVPPPQGPVLQQGALRDYLLANGLQLRPDGQPRAGDLILYEDGFCMFYFPDQNRSPFVIGMTVSSIKIFSPDFTTPTAVIAVLP